MIRVYIGWDPRDAVAFEVCRKTLLDRSSIPLTIIPLKDWELRRKGVYWRPYRVDERGQRWDDRDGKPFSTDFSFTRFCIPLLEEYKSGPVLFCDPDMLWRTDVAELFDLYDPAKAVQCVQHDHRPPETEKGVGLQTVYHRKNWSSMMLLNPAKCEHLTQVSGQQRDRAMAAYHVLGGGRRYRGIAGGMELAGGVELAGD